MERIFSPTSKPTAPQRSVASTKPTHRKHTTHAKPTAHAKSRVRADAKGATKSATSQSATKKSITGSSTYASYGEGAEGAGITDPVDTKKTVSGTRK